MAKTSKPKATPTVSATDALMRDVMKKQEIAKAVIISRAADFTGKSGSENAATAAAPSAPRAAARRKPAASPSPSIERRSALAGSEASGSGVRAALLPPAQRVSLRAPAASLSALSKALGLNLPAKPKTSTSDDGRTALWLGPDEWLVIDEAGGDSLADCAKVKALHSAVDVSHRNVAILVSGAACEAALSSGCPQDLSLYAFPVGACSRTILGKAEIVLLRTAEDAFRVECWRSFSDYVFGFLADAAQDAAA